MIPTVAIIAALAGYCIADLVADRRTRRLAGQAYTIGFTDGYRKSVQDFNAVENYEYRMLEKLAEMPDLREGQ